MNMSTLEQLPQRRDSLPCPEAELFTRNPLRFPNWYPTGIQISDIIKSFKASIERKTKEPSEWLYSLGKYTASAVKEAVRDLLSLDNVDAYSKAKKILTNHSGNQFTVDAFRKRINSWLKIQPNYG